MSMPTVHKLLPDSDISYAKIREYEMRNATPKKSGTQIVSESEQASINKSIINNVFSEETKIAEFNKFSTGVKNSLVSECVYKLFKGSFPEWKENLLEENKLRAIVGSFVQEEGATALLTRFKSTSNMLSECALAIEKAYKSIVEKANKNNPESFTADPNDVDTFFQDLDAVNADEALVSIRSRVLDAESEFLDQNAADQEDIKNMMLDAKEKMEQAKTDKIREAVELESRRRINIRKNIRPRSIYESMVQSYIKGVVKNEALRESYLVEGTTHLDIDKIVDNVSVMYTFLEMVNSTMMRKIDESYINGVLKDIGDVNG